MLLKVFKIIYDIVFFVGNLLVCEVYVVGIVIVYIVVVFVYDDVGVVIVGCEGVYFIVYFCLIYFECGVRNYF